MADLAELDQQIASARSDVERDIAALEVEIRRERALAEAKLRSNAVAVVGGAVALGLLFGFGGTRAFKALAGVGVMGGAAYWLANQIANE